ncbi:MAG: hypothetical protein SVX43_02535 [Cyanobacteriota bacterium]|nr:hypothetical protein [Cyanobacteriota bacterium]
MLATKKVKWARSRIHPGTRSHQQSKSEKNAEPLAQQQKKEQDRDG